MGWFWADSAPRPSIAVAPHPVPKDGAAPPPSCPMHKPDASSSSSPFPPQQDDSSSKTSSCPVKSPAQSSRYATSPSEPQSPSSSQESKSVLSRLNPLNYMPTLSNTRLDDSPQGVSLPLSREISSIPRGDADTNWEYPSPQQMYNAMLRKGNGDIPTDAVESMVAVHNFLNEGAWNEICEWESIFASGFIPGWDKVKNGEQGLAMERAKQEYLAARREALGTNTTPELAAQPRLLRFQGRPNEPTPKARVLQYLSWAFPEKFGTEPPFDRHDWYVARKQHDGSVREVRYVIDYYGGGLQATGEPVFYLDIRPALDSPTAAVERAMRWGGDVWHRASGASVRENSSKP